MSLQREYLRDITRFLARQRDSFPAFPVGYFTADTETKLASYEAQASIERTLPLSIELPLLTLRRDLATGVAASAIVQELARIPFRRRPTDGGHELISGTAHPLRLISRKHFELMTPTWSSLKVHLNNRLSRHLHARTVQAAQCRANGQLHVRRCPGQRGDDRRRNARGIPGAGHLLCGRRDRQHLVRQLDLDQRRSHRRSSPPRARDRLPHFLA